MRAIMVSVDYSDLLEVTLPYNRHHFEEVMVVTTPRDLATLQVAAACEARTFVTDSFYKDGAAFNKWRALEEGLDAFGREGWLCIMDADVLWPKGLKWEEESKDLGLVSIPVLNLAVGETWSSYPASYLCSPLRRMCSLHEGRQAASEPSSERWWNRFPIHRNVAEWAGYTQIFHVSDPALGNPPWHQVDWIHAGGADSFFQAKWPRERKVRPPFEVLHLGEPGVNWFGRTPEGREKSRAIWQRRRELRAEGKDQFEEERLT